jgi:hypothetical protein
MPVFADDIVITDGVLTEYLNLFSGSPDVCGVSQPPTSKPC